MCAWASPVLCTRKSLCEEGALMQITLLPRGTGTQDVDRRNMTYKDMLENPEKSYRRSRNHKVSMGPASQLRNHTRFLPLSPPVLCLRVVMFFWFAVFVNHHTLTVDQTAADAASRGLTDKITSVSFHPWMNPIIIPARNVAKNCTNIQILSPMPSWMVLMSL